MKRLALLVAVVVCGPAWAQGVEVRQADHDVSPPLMLIPPAAKPAREYDRKQRLPPMPHGPRSGDAVDPVRNLPGGEAPLAPLAPAPIFSFSGLGQNFTNLDGSTINVAVMPPDTNGEVGPEHYVAIINTELAVFDANTHQLLYGSVPVNSMFQGFAGGNGQCAGTNDGDPVVLYDQFADRWIISQFAVSVLPGFECVAVSATGDPLGQWNRYAFGPYQTPPLGPDGGFTFDSGTQTRWDSFNDYPKLSVWTDAYFATYNQFSADLFGTQSAFSSSLCAFDKAAMLQGGPATEQCFNLNPACATCNGEFDNGNQFLGGVLPADLDGTQAPPAGSPGLFIGFLAGSDGGSYVGLWRMHVDFATPTNSTLNGTTTYPFLPTYVSGVAPFFPSVATTLSGGGVVCPPVTDAFGQTRSNDCIQEPDRLGTASGKGFNFLDSLGDRMMFRATYRRFSTDGGIDSLLANHTVLTALKNTANTGIRWYEIRNPFDAAPAIYQQQTFAPDNTIYRWMGAMAQDQFGDIALGYSATARDGGLPDGGPLYPSVFYTARTATEPLGTMEGEQVLALGNGSQGGGAVGTFGDFDRWGDYSDMAVDPVDDCTFWYTQELIPYTETFNWTTTVGSFRFPNCLPVGRYTLTGAATPTAGTPVTVTATVVDRSGAPVSSYNGTGNLTSSDPGISSTPVTITAGVGHAAVTFTQPGPQTLKITDAANPLLRGKANATVSIGPAAKYAFSGVPANSVAGEVFNVTLSAVDAAGNVVAAYAGSAKVTSSDPRATLPGNVAFTKGVSAPFPVTLVASGSQTVVATDTAVPAMTASATSVVSAGAASRYSISGLSPSTKSGSAVSVTVTAQDPYGNTVTGYHGTAHFTSSDAKAVLPADTAFTQGVSGAASVTFKTAGTQTLDASDTTLPITGEAVTNVTGGGCGCSGEGGGLEVSALVALAALARRLRKRPV
jgi:hypothetical protein